MSSLGLNPCADFCSLIISVRFILSPFRLRDEICGLILSYLSIRIEGITNNIQTMSNINLRYYPQIGRSSLPVMKYFTGKL